MSNFNYKLSDFVATRRFVKDVTKFDDECMHFADAYREGTSGYLFLNARLFIEQCSDGTFYVDLFGASFDGTLDDCTAELWRAADGESMFDDSPCNKKWNTPTKQYLALPLDEGDSK